MAPNNSKQILVAPLDWGLGHTSRCVPLIRHLLLLGCRVLVAGNESQRTFLTKIFPQVEQVHLDGYNVRYARSSAGFMPRMAAQIPGLVRTVKNEHAWLEQLAKERNLAGVISDNRYGLYHASIPSVILTHQLNVLTGMGKTVDSFLRKIHYRFLEQFKACWVVDVAGQPNLSGKLAHPSSMPKNGQYIGLLSQLEGWTPSAQKDHLLVLLSGPEPQRTLLAKKLWTQVVEYKGKVVFVEGTTGSEKPGFIPDHISYHNRVSTQELLPLMQNAAMVICRSGYSTLMDLAVAQKKAIIIPTPGQTEQVYLATHLDRQGILKKANQEQFSLQKTLAEATTFPFHPLPLKDVHEGYKPVLEAWVAGL